MTARYQHNCSACVFLGCYEEYDLYCCPQGFLDQWPTVVARYGNDGPEYSSMPVEILKTEAVTLGEPFITGWNLYLEKSASALFGKHKG